ncbi:MAG: alpha/beta hydrolase [Acidobacteriota bacterium]|nr:MAG: alpha/beta hydrolase [Acidobacteriota bacterium]
MSRWTLLTAALLAAMSFACAPGPTEEPAEAAEPLVLSGTVPSADGVPIAYTSTGSGVPAIVFIHGGYADQSFWAKQIEPLSARYQLVTLDLAAHGGSGKQRGAWTIDAFGEDVRAVIEALELESVYLVGNSLGGPVGLSAARMLPGTVRGLIAVDTLQDVNRDWSPERIEAYVQSLRDDFPATCKAMVRQLLVEDTDPDLYAWIETKMCGFDPSIAPDIVAAFVDYDPAAEFSAAQVPVRAILGEITPLDLEGNRELLADFDAIVMEGCGHYPMLERPEEFNQHLIAYVEELQSR